MSNDTAIVDKTGRVLKAVPAPVWNPPLLYNWVEDVKRKPGQAYYLKPIVPADACVMISGRQKVAKKSYFCRKLALMLASGREFKPWGTPIAPIPVLYFDQEGPEILSGLRWETLARSNNLDLATLKNFYYMHREPILLDTDLWRVRICAFIKENGIRVVIIDPLAKVHKADENDEQSLQPVLSCMDAFRRAGATVIFVHHLRKEVKKIVLAEDIDVDARGSTSIAAHYDVHMGFRATKTEENLMLYVVGKHCEPHSYGVKWEINEDDEDVLKRHAKVSITKVKEDDKDKPTKVNQPKRKYAAKPRKNTDENE